MLFNSIIFLVFALLFFLVLRLIGQRNSLRLIWITLASLFFYAWWDWRFIFLIVFSGMVDYLAAIGMVHYKNRKKLLLILSVIANIGSLSIFKYSGFFAQNIDQLLGLGTGFTFSANVPEFMLITPVGISFYTFQSMSYTIDVYRGELKPTKKVIHFFAYLSMFPQLVAGPIVRARTMLPQMLRSRFPNKNEQWQGLRLLVHGYFKKMVIADNLAPIVASAFSAHEINASSMYWWGIMVAFAFQIYCDFSGYSDIARGVAKWMGYDFPDNFNHPYLSASLREFWSRWHISLSTWFKDYVYIPLGGGREGKIRTHINLWITMLVSGFWHGAAWTFVVWGGVHALLSSVERLTNWPQRLSQKPFLKFIAWMMIMCQVLIAWVFFRADSISQAFHILQVMFAFKGSAYLGWGINGTSILLVIMFRELFVASKLKIALKKPIWEMLFYAFLIAITIFFRGEGSEFIYFQF